VLGFAKQSGGGVRVETRVGEGTSVKVFLPRAEVVLRDHELESDVEQGPRIKVTASILVVDDDTAVLRTTRRMLDALGYAAVSNESGPEALSADRKRTGGRSRSYRFCHARMTGV